MTNHDWRNKARDDATREATMTEIFGQVVIWESCVFKMPQQNVAYMWLIFWYFLTGKRYDHFGFAQYNSSYYGKAVGR